MLFVTMLLWCTCAAANDYAEQRIAAIRQCEPIDPKQYHTGLIMNPDGYRSYYLRSQCFQRAAIKFRDPELCGEVRRRRALFSSSWGYSEKNCRKLVAAGIAEDRDALDAMKAEYESGHVRITDFTVLRNGNGRDFDIIPRFAGQGEHGYELRFDILPAGTGSAPVLLHATGFYLKGTENRIRIYVKRADLRTQFPAFREDVPYTVRATLTYSTGYGTLAGKWSDAFIEDHFPVAARSQDLVKEVTFGGKWVPEKYP